MWLKCTVIRCNAFGIHNLSWRLNYILRAYFAVRVEQCAKKGDILCNLFKINKLNSAVEMYSSLIQVHKYETIWVGFNVMHHIHKYLPRKFVSLNP